MTAAPRGFGPPPALVWLGLCAAATLGLAGCDTTQRTAHQEATTRWNLARSEVKARLAADQFQAGNLTAAAAELDEAERLAPTDKSRLPLRARILLGTGQLTEAADLLERALADGQTDAELEYLLGVARQQQQRWPEAQAAFARALAADPRATSYLSAAVESYLQLGLAAEARALLDRVAPQLAWTEAYQAAQAECAEQLGDWTAAAAAWRQVAAARDATPTARERLAEALFRAGQYADALPLWEELAAPAPGHAPTSGPADETYAYARLMQSECYLATGRAVPAREIAQTLVQQQPESLPALRLLARCLAAEGKLDLALRAARRALAVAPQDVPALELVAALAWRSGDRALATTAAQRLAAVQPDNAVAQRLLAATPAP
jgi:tetratricopeptide (TPR) repeat protein